MKLLIHDYSPEEQPRIIDSYKGWTILSGNGKIRPCIGCFSCWTGGTGQCVFKDGYENMCALIHNADEITVISRYTYGGFSSFVKNVFDRSLGYVLPEFETAYGEMHHRRRFPEEKQVTFCFRGPSLTEEEKEKARNYVAAVCRNLRGAVKDVLFESCAAEEKPLSEVTERSGILLVDCSLRGSRSNTAVFLKRLQGCLKQPSDLLSLSSSEAEKIAGAIGKAKTIVIGVPLYVDGIPSSALRLMETVKKSRSEARLYAVVNNGLYESRQNENLLRMIRDWGADCGFEYCGALAIGAGEVMGTLMRNTKHILWPARNVLRGLSRLADAVDTDRNFSEQYADAFLFPRRLYILIANANWQLLKKQARRKNKG